MFFMDADIIPASAFTVSLPEMTLDQNGQNHFVIFGLNPPLSAVSSKPPSTNWRHWAFCTKTFVWVGHYW